jgi:tetratricopeptide (TPR) repeat protein
MIAFAPLVALLLLLAFAPAPAPAALQTQAPAKTTQTVSLVDLLVEGQTLYTLAVDKQKEDLTAALDLARQAQRSVADDTVKKRLSRGEHAEPQDLAVLGALRARISVLVGAIEKQRTIAMAADLRAQADRSKAMGLPDEAIALYRRAQAIDPAAADYDALCIEAREHAAWLFNKRKEIRDLLTDRRLLSTAREMAAVDASLPANAKLYQFEVLRTELLARQQDLTVTVQGAEEAMTARKYTTAERLWRDAAAIDREQSFTDQIRRAKELGGGRSWVAKIFQPDVWLKKPVSQIRALVQVVRR